MTCYLHELFNATARGIRKVRRARRFDRVKAAKPLHKDMASNWGAGMEALFTYLGESEAWDKIQRHCQLAAAADQVAKVLSDSDRKLIADLLANFDIGDVANEAALILQAASLDTFEDAAKFALGQIGVRAADFELRNERIADRLAERKDAAIFATRNGIEQAMDTVLVQFHELGRNPFNREFLDKLKDDLGFEADWQAKRFALTETGIAAELAQVETYRRNGVQRKQWNILGANTRPTHAELSGVQVDVEATFDVGGFAADHPCDPNLPPEELINCHCWLSPVVDDDFTLDPERIWEGQ